VELNDSEIDELWRIAKTDAFSQTHQLEVTKSDLVLSIAQVMRAACPVPGDTWDKFMTVALKPGRSVHPHEHDRHLIVFYPEACDPIVVEGKQIDLQAGHILYMLPDTTHEVPMVTRPRLSIAMLVTESRQSPVN